MKIGSALWMLFVLCSLWGASGLSWVMLAGISLVGLVMNLMSRHVGGDGVRRDRFGHWVVWP